MTLKKNLEKYDEQEQHSEQLLAKNGGEA